MELTPELQLIYNLYCDIRNIDDEDRTDLERNYLRRCKTILEANNIPHPILNPSN
jgi:hypothetical protein